MPRSRPPRRPSRSRWPRYRPSPTAKMPEKPGKCPSFAPMLRHLRPPHPNSRPRTRLTNLRHNSACAQKPPSSRGLKKPAADLNGGQGQGDTYLWERKPLPTSYIRRERPSTPSAHMARPVRLSPRTGLLFSARFCAGRLLRQRSQEANGRCQYHCRRAGVAIVALWLLDRSKVLHKIMLSRRVESSQLGSASVSILQAGS